MACAVWRGSTAQHAAGRACAVQVMPLKNNHVLPVMPRMRAHSAAEPEGVSLGDLEAALVPMSVPRKITPSLYALQVRCAVPGCAVLCCTCAAHL